MTDGDRAPYPAVQLHMVINQRFIPTFYTNCSVFDSAILITSWVGYQYINSAVKKSKTILKKIKQENIK